MGKINGTVAITGYGGRLGSMLVGQGFVPLICDITDSDSIKRALKEVEPAIVINCAAYTDVDGAEEDREISKRVNQEGVMRLREAHDGWLIHISTDYVFGGKKGPYSETFRKDEDRPASIYGITKSDGEEYVLNDTIRLGTVVRTTMLYGNPDFPDFVTRVLFQLRNGLPFNVPTNIVGSPTYIPHLVEGMLSLMLIYEYNPPLILNIAGSDLVSRYDLALMIASVWGYDKGLISPTRAKVGAALRPHKAGLRLSLAKKLGIPIYSVIDGLEAMKNEEESKIM